MEISKIEYVYFIFWQCTLYILKQALLPKHRYKYCPGLKSCPTSPFAWSCGEGWRGRGGEVIRRLCDKLYGMNQLTKWGGASYRVHPLLSLELPKMEKEGGARTDVDVTAASSLMLTLEHSPMAPKFSLNKNKTGPKT